MSGVAAHDLFGFICIDGGDAYEAAQLLHEIRKMRFEEGYYGGYRKGGGGRNYTWVKQRLQEAGLARKSDRKPKHRRRRFPMPLPGMIIHQVPHMRPFFIGLV
jgi:hypothetical protein